MTNKLEALIRKVARELEDNQIAKLYKIPEAMQQTPCDFIGFTSKGRAILLECKILNKPSLPIGKDGLKTHQWNALLDADRAGCIALICWMRRDRIAVLSFSAAYANSVLLDRKSVPWLMASSSVADKDYLYQTIRSYLMIG